MVNYSVKIKTIFSFFITFFMLFSFNANAQRYVDKSGETSFFSATAVEDIQAMNKKTTVLLDATTNTIAVKMQITEFEFPNKLMQEHFNENYLESEKFPTCIFSGKINETIDYTKNGTYTISATGKFIVHGVVQERTLKGKLRVEGTKLFLTTTFDIKLADHKIDVPSVVIAKVSDTIAVKTSFALQKLN
jgi:polyisoprenoid-binding protein YceI